jgi:hypothetical protein
MADDIISATGADVDRLTIGGVERQLKKLTIYDRARLMVEDRKANKQALTETLKVSGASCEDMVATLQAFDRKKTLDSDWPIYVDQPENAVPIFAASLERTYPGEGEKLAREIELDPGDSFVLRVKLAGLVLKPSPAASPTDDNRTFGDEGDDPNAKTPATFTTTPAETPATPIGV